MPFLMPLEGYLDQIRVPRENQKLLERLAEILVEWNEKINLVGASTIPEMWCRHFWDSAQLYPLFPRATGVLVDLGSGAGFPGLVLSVIGMMQVHLIEATGKKAEFLRVAAAEVAPRTIIHNARIETIRDLEADVVTARAVAPLPELLSLAKPFWKKDTVGLFLKGEKVDAELTEARKYWTFTVERKQSLTDKTGVILMIKELKIRKDK